MSDLRRDLNRFDRWLGKDCNLIVAFLLGVEAILLVAFPLFLVWGPGQ